MTKAKTGYCPPHCRDCVEWERSVELEGFGLCCNPQSDHHGHLVRKDHAACRKIMRHTIVSSRHANRDWFHRKSQAEKAKGVRPLPPPDI